MKLDWPADKVERWPLGRLVPDARNAPDTYSDAQVAQIAASIEEWGWTNPVLVDESGGVIAGHGRILAARQLGIEDASVMIARGLERGAEAGLRDCRQQAGAECRLGRGDVAAGGCGRRGLGVMRKKFFRI